MSHLFCDEWLVFFAHFRRPALMPVREEGMRECEPWMSLAFDSSTPPSLQPFLAITAALVTPTITFPNLATTTPQRTPFLLPFLKCCGSRDTARQDTYFQDRQAHHPEAVHQHRCVPLLIILLSRSSIIVIARGALMIINHSVLGKLTRSPFPYRLR